MFSYRVKYNESEYDIKDNNLLYKIDQKCQKTFDLFEQIGTFLKKSNSYFIIYIYIVSIFCIFVSFIMFILFVHFILLVLFFFLVFYMYTDCILY